MSIPEERSVVHWQGLALTGERIGCSVDTAAGSVTWNLSPEPQPDERNNFLLPGLLDLQVNGYSGIDYSGAGLSVPDVVKIVNDLSRSGTPRHLPTLITGSFKQTAENLRVLAKARSEFEPVREALPGFHIEGPYISGETGPRGAHDPDFIRDPDLEEFAFWQEAAGTAIRMITLAPERKNALSCIETWSREGVIVAIGHTAADPGLIREAAACGATVSTHLGNGTHAMLSRHDNYLWEQLVQDDLYASLICDGDHLPSSFITGVLRIKPEDRILLISDVTSLAGAKPGRYHWGSMEVEVSRSGRLGLADTPFLAGAGHNLLYDCSFLLNDMRLPIVKIAQGASINPALLLGEQAPSLAPWRDAPDGMNNFSLAHTDKETGALTADLTVLGSMVYGENLYTERYA